MRTDVGAFVVTHGWSGGGGASAWVMCVGRGACDLLPPVSKLCVGGAWAVATVMFDMRW